MRRFRADEVVASVVGRANHDVTLGESLVRALKYGHRKMRAIAVKRYDAAVTRRREMSEHRSEARSEPVARLRHDGNRDDRFTR